MVTEVDEEGRHDDLPSLRAELEVKKKHVEEAGLADVEARAQRLESELAQLEAEGAEASQRDKLRKTAEREMGALRRDHGHASAQPARPGAHGQGVGPLREPQGR